MAMAYPFFAGALAASLGASLSWTRFNCRFMLLDSQHEAFPGLAQPGRWIRGGLQIDVFRRPN
jgi:hypothetical protein